MSTLKFCCAEQRFSDLTLYKNAHYEKFNTFSTVLYATVLSESYGDYKTEICIAAHIY